MKTNQKAIEILLNQIYEAPDLGVGVFDVLKPSVMNAYLLIKNHNFQKENNQLGIFTNPEDLFALESILYNDLANIIDVYSKLPLEYRNTILLKTNKTHRQTLLENIETLMQRMAQIEKLQYEESDIKAIVKTNVIDEKYSRYESINVESELEAQSLSKQRFDFNLFKKQQPTLNKDMSWESINQNKDNNTLIKIQEGEIKYAVKDKMKPFMRGVYNAATSVMKLTKKMIPALINTKDCIVYIAPKMAFNTMIFCLVSSPLLVPGTVMGIMKYNSYKENRLVDQIIEVEEYAKKESNSQLRDINIRLLEEYAKKAPELNMIINKENNTVSLDLKLNSNECINVTKNIYKAKGLFITNGIEGAYIKEEPAKILCEKPENHITTTYKLTR